MDCNLVRQLLPFATSGNSELDSADRSALDQHIAICPACADASAADRVLDAQLACAMRAVRLPDGFSARLETRLIAARMAYYRRLLLKALIVCVAVGLGWSGYSAWRRPTFDPLQLAQQTYELNGASRGPDEAQNLAAAWLRQFDHRLEAPNEFNYNLLSFAESSQFQGLAAVPTLVFARQNATMRVYVVREHQLTNLVDVHEETGGCSVETRRYHANPGSVFIIVTSGAPPDAFRPPARPSDPA